VCLAILLSPMCHQERQHLDCIGKYLGMGAMVGFGPVVVLVPGPTVFHGLNIGFVIWVCVCFALPWDATVMVFVAVTIAADESLVSLLGCFEFAGNMVAVMFIHQVCLCC